MIKANIIKSETNFRKLFSEDNPLKLLSGESLNRIDTAYQTYGNLNEEGDNAVLICHAFTGNSHAAGIIEEDEVERSVENIFLHNYNKLNQNKSGWWDPLIGPDRVFDTNKYYVICPNILGSCYGTTGPGDVDLSKQKKHNLTFPQIHVRDIVNAQYELLRTLGVNKLKLVTGGSLGGMQALEWGIMYKKFVERIAPIAASYKQSQWAIGFNKLSREAIYNDPAWNQGEYELQPIEGLALARKIAMLSYRSFSSFNKKFTGDNFNKNKYSYMVESYLDYQGEKFVKRFDANTFIYLSNTLDSHDITKERGDFRDVLKTISAETLSIGIDSDILYPAKEQKLLAEYIPNSKFEMINSEHGHDAFLIEFAQIEGLFRNFLAI